MTSVRNFLLQYNENEETNQVFYNNKCDYLLEYADDFTDGTIIFTEAFENDLRVCTCRTDIQKLILKFFDSRTKVTKMVQDIICDSVAGKSTELGLKLAKSLIRVAATRIFVEPEQSIMELPVNSIDSYNSEDTGSFSVGKFGMGFFSILYWIAQVTDDEYLRTIEIVSSFRENNKIITYSCHLSWTTEGLKSVMWYRKPQNKTGTKIRISCANHRLSPENVKKMHSYIDRLSDVPGVAISCNGIIVNGIGADSPKKIYITLTDTLVEVLDFAKGISPKVIETSLLVPTSSTKIRSLDVPDIIPFRITPNGKERHSLKILVSGVCLVNVELDEKDTACVNYIINLPHNSKLPVSRDDVIFEKDSLELLHFIISANDILSHIIRETSSILQYINLIKEYGVRNKSPFLNRAIDSMIFSIRKLPYIFVPDMPFWRKFNERIKLRQKVIFYDSSLIFDAEQKFLNEIKNVTECYTNIFKSRTVVILDFLQKNTTETGGFVSIIFTKIVNPIVIKRFVMTHSQSLLIPTEEIEESGLTFQPRASLRKILEILCMTFDRKTSSFSDDNSMELFNTCIEKFANLPLSTKFLNMFFTMFCSKISDSRVKKNYGSQYFIVYPKFFIPNEWDFEFPEVDIVDLSRVQTKLLEFFISIYTESHFCKYKIPDSEDFLIVFDDERLIKEFKELDNMCPGNAELFLINLILREIDFKKKFSNYKTLDGICSYILSEIRKEITNSALEKEISYFYSTALLEIAHSFRLKLINRAFKSGIMYLDLKNKVLMKITEFELTEQCVFSCKSLIKDLFNEDGDRILYENSTETYKTFDPNSMNMQIVEIAVNDGTNKSFVPAVLTELIQNSIDAIRTNACNKQIHINIGEDFISVRDSAGIEDITQILIPFLSSKDPNDPRVTGEIGTGFFNVYRQPYVKCVKIETVYSDMNIEIIGIPQVENGLVVDIIYHLRQLETTVNPYTNITIVFNNNINIISSVIVEAQLFSQIYFSFINAADIYLNGERCVVESKPIYSNSDIGDFRLTKSRTALSFILTNDIPFSMLQDVDLIPEELKSPFIKFGSNSIVLNLSKNVYSPTQSRNKISIFPSMLQEVKFFITNGIIRCIFQKYIDQSMEALDEIIEHTYSKSSIYQLLPVNGPNIFMNYKFGESYMGIKELDVGSTIRYVIDLCKKEVITDISVLPNDTLYERVIYSWFLPKNISVEKRRYHPVYSNPEDFGNELDYTISRSPNLLSTFVYSYWKHVKTLVDRKILRGVSMLKPSPRLVFEDTGEGVLGYFSGAFDLIALNNKLFDYDEIETRLLSHKEVDFKYINFSKDETFKHYFSNSTPACVLIHELTHAILNTSYDHQDRGTHGRTSIAIGDKVHPDFEEAAFSIYSHVIADGMLETFLVEMRKVI